MKDAIRQALQDITRLCGDSIFSDPSKFKGVLADILPGTDNEPMRNLLNNAIGGMDSYLRLKNSIARDGTLAVVNLIKEMNRRYFIPEDVCHTVIDCIVELLGREPVVTSISVTNVDREHILLETQKPKVGDLYLFGGYDWRVLEVQEKQILLLSDKILEQRAYHSSYSDITWDNCALRQYLNDEFYNKFNQSDKDRIILVFFAN